LTATSSNQTKLVQSGETTPKNKDFFHPVEEKWGPNQEKSDTIYQKRSSWGMPKPTSYTRVSPFRHPGSNPTPYTNKTNQSWREPFRVTPFVLKPFPLAPAALATLENVIKIPGMDLVRTL
jgi:hypothetical protein